jgi:large subunit ribosomal protein L3
LKSGENNIEYFLQNKSEINPYLRHQTKFNHFEFTMLNGLLARKMGMTQIFQDDGTVQPVTVLQAGPMTVVQKKTKDKDGCDHVQVGFEEIPERKLNKPAKGHFKDNSPTRFLREFEVEDIDQVEVGQVFGVDLFTEGESVAVSGNSKGKGFTGVMKRHGFHGQPASHGHRGHRGTGSIGQCATPSRVFKGKKMHGRHGNSKVTQLGLKIVIILTEEKIVLVKGSVPGPNGGLVKILKSNR